MNMKIKAALDLIKPDNDLINKIEMTLTERDCNRYTNKKKLHFCFAAGFAFFLVFCCFMYQTYQKPVAIVCLDINPSMELKVNCFDRVVNINCLNSEAELLLKNKKLYGKKLSQAMNVVISAANEEGYIKKDQTTIVSIFIYSNKKIDDTHILNECKKELHTSNKDIEIISDTVTSELLKEAKELSISTGKLKIIKMIQQLDKNASVDEYKNNSMTSLIYKLVYLTTNEFSGADQDTRVLIQNYIRTLGIDLESFNKIINQNSSEDEDMLQDNNISKEKENRADSNSNVVGKPDEKEMKKSKEVEDKAKDNEEDNQTFLEAETSMTTITKEQALDVVEKSKVEATIAREAASSREQVAKAEAEKAEQAAKVVSEQAEAEAAAAREAAIATEQAAKEEAEKAEAEAAAAREEAIVTEQAAKEGAEEAEAEAAAAREEAIAAEQAAKEEAEKAKAEAEKAKAEAATTR